MPEHRYDLFISYSTKDRDWVQAELLAPLEAARVKVCIDYRDFAPGATILGEIERGLDESRKTVLVFSPHYLRSEWTALENLILQTDSPVNRDGRFLIILKAPCELPRRLKPFIYVDFTRPDEQSYAWERLFRFLDIPIPNPALPVPGAASPVHAARQALPNPFIVGLTVPPERFYGRREQLADVRYRIGGYAPQSISVVGLRRSGKSSLLRYITERIHEFCSPEQQPIVVSLDLQSKRFHTPDGITEGLRRGIKTATGRELWQSADNADPWAVQEGLERLHKDGQRLIVLIDEFEHIGTHLAHFQDWGDDWRSKASAGLLTLVIATTRPLSDIYSHVGLTSPFGNIFTTTILSPFAPADWHRLVQDGFQQGSAAVGSADLALIDDLAGGVPFYTQLAASLLWQHGDQQRVRQEFRLQAEPQFAGLWQHLRPDEQHALRHAAGLAGLTTPHTNLRATLQRSGLLRPDGRLFSSAFADFVQAQL